MPAGSKLALSLRRERHQRRRPAARRRRRRCGRRRARGPAWRGRRRPRRRRGSIGAPASRPGTAGDPDAGRRPSRRARGSRAHGAAPRRPPAPSLGFTETRQSGASGGASSGVEVADRLPQRRPTCSASSAVGAAEAGQQRRASARRDRRPRRRSPRCGCSVRVASLPAAGRCAAPVTDQGEPSAADRAATAARVVEAGEDQRRLGLRRRQDLEGHLGQHRRACRRSRREI